MNRREFLLAGGLAGIGSLAAKYVDPQSSFHQGQIMTVLGPIPPEVLGSTLSHEHVLVDFIGAEAVSRDRYDAEEAYEVILPYLQKVRELGCQGFVECTPAYLGRDPLLLKRLADATGLHLLTNTGYYGAANDRYIPEHAYQETADQLADRWVKEWQEGIEGTGIRPGFIKIGVDGGPLSEIDRKLAQAAARTHTRTGLTIASHTGNTRAAMDQMEIFAEEGVKPEAFIWVHAQSDWELKSRIDAAQKGMWIEIDNIDTGSVAECVNRVNTLKQRGLLSRLLVSHDAGWYSPGEPKGGSFRGFDTAYTTFLPALRQARWTEEEIHQLMVVNPFTAFAVRIRKTTSGSLF